MVAGHGPKEITAQLFKQEGVSFDWTKFTLLGRLFASQNAFAVDRKLGWKTPADLRGKTFIAAGSSPFFEPLLAEALGWDKMVFIPGMSGGERVLAMRRGEIQACAGGPAQLQKDADLMMPIVVTTKDEKGFPGIPSAAEAAVKGKEKWGRMAGAWDGLLYWPMRRRAFRRTGRPSWKASWKRSTTTRGSAPMRRSSSPICRPILSAVPN